MGPDGGHGGTPLTSGLDALPVAVDPLGDDDAAVRRWVEGVLGWQVVDAATATFVPPALRLAGAGSTSSGGEVPTILVVGDAAPPDHAAERTVALRPDAVLRWPSDRLRLTAVASEVLARRVPVVGGTSVVTVGGVAGGVGTTTVALALAGLDGWAGHDTLVAFRGHGPAATCVEPAALTAVDLWARATLLPGTDRVHAVRLVEPVRACEPVPPPADPRVERCVVDLGVDPDADVVVARADGATLAAADDIVARLVVVVGAGVVPIARLRRALAGRRVVDLPTSSRVARAGARGRLPAGFPGSYLQRLLPVHRLVRA